MKSRVKGYVLRNMRRIPFQGMIPMISALSALLIKRVGLSVLGYCDVKWVSLVTILIGVLSVEQAIG